MRKKKKKEEVAWTELKYIQVQKGFNLRGKVKPDPELVDRVKKDGVLHPIHIRNAPDGACYLLVDGERRYQAARAAGLKSIPVILHDSMSDEEAMLFSYRANEEQKPWTPGEKFKMFRKLTKMGWDPAKIESTLLVSHKTLLEYLKTQEKGSQKVQEALANGEVSARTASKVSSLPKRKQSEVVEKVSGKSTKKSMETVKEEESKRKKWSKKSGASETPEYLAEDFEQRCKHLEELIYQQLDMSPRHKVLKGQLGVIQVLRGKKVPEEIFPEYVMELRSGHGG